MEISPASLSRLLKITFAFALAVSPAKPLGATLLSATETPPASADALVLQGAWKMQAAPQVKASPEEISSPAFQPAEWYAATVPGTVLTTLTNNRVYPEPLFGENNRPDRIPESLARTSFWYRTSFVVPKSFSGKKIWLNFDGINYSADIWVNGKQVGTMQGAFARGVFDVSSVVAAGRRAVVAVLVHPQPHPGKPHEHTITAGMGSNGGVTAVDGATFLCSIGWDWIPAIRDRNTGIWQKVFLSASGPVKILDPLINTKVSPKHDYADVSIAADLQNTTNEVQKGVLKGRFGKVSFERPVEIQPGATERVQFGPEAFPALHVKNPELWWPNGYGPQNLQTLQLAFEKEGVVSDRRKTSFGLREITYEAPGSENLAICVNGVPIFSKGGNWGMDEAMKRIPRARLDAQVRMHQIANNTIIRNWVGQSTSEDFYDMCDKYGILVWDEFFQPNPGDGPDPTDIKNYIENVREKVTRFRNHPSIALWCARNEGFAPKEIDDELTKLLAELDPARHYQRSSISGKGVHSSGPYCWRTPREFYDFPAIDVFACEIGSVSIPTLESIHGMLDKKDWEQIDDAWAEHDFAAGASGGEWYTKKMSERYGDVRNLADFARKGQLMNYEAFRALYEGRNAKLFAPVTGVINWMSNPAQPSFVWQLYHHDLEPNSALFAVRKACEPVHIQLNEKEERLEVINNLPAPLQNARVKIAIFNADGTRVYQKEYSPVNAPGGKATVLGKVEWPANLSSVHFIKLELEGWDKKLISENFYWRPVPERLNNLKDLDQLPIADLQANVKRADENGKCLLTATLKNPTPHVALMAHLQLRRKSGERVLPVFYSDNYVSLLPGESKTITIETELAYLKGESPVVAVDGWNVNVASAPGSQVPVVPNKEALVASWPVTHLPIVANTWVSTLPASERFRINAGGKFDVPPFEADEGYSGGHDGPDRVVDIDASAPGSAPEAVYKSGRWGDSTYTFKVKSPPKGQAYKVKLHFAETTFDAPGKRKFSVDINGARVLSEFDPFQEAGAKNKAINREFHGILPDSKNQIVLKFSKGSQDEAEVCGIEIEPEPAKPRQP